MMADYHYIFVSLNFRTFNKGLANQKSTICHVLDFACFIEALNETHN